MYRYSNKTVAFITLGCKLNFSETSTLARQFIENGFSKISHNKSADIYVINTCSVTEHADKKCRNLIRRVHKINPDALIAVTGCYAQLKPKEILDIEGVDLVLGADEKMDLFNRVSKIIDLKNSSNYKEKQEYVSCDIFEVNSFFAAYSTDERSRSFLKVQDGCDYHCSYCTIPLARGKSRNIPIERVVKEANEIVSKGICEIVLTGVNTGDFGKTTGESFLDMLKELDRVEGLERVRISSIEPNLLTDEILTFIKNSRVFLPHFHIPLQSGSNKILKLMRRRYTRELFENKILLIKKLMPKAFVGIDVIVGFPGEGDEEFMETLFFLKKIAPSFIHVFPYSKRDNTPASLYSDQVKEINKRERVLTISQLSQSLYNDFYISQKGEKEFVLFESTEKCGKMFGYTRNYIRIERDYDSSMIGKVCEVIID